MSSAPGDVVPVHELLAVVLDHVGDEADLDGLHVREAAAGREPGLQPGPVVRGLRHDVFLDRDVGADLLVLVVEAVLLEPEGAEQADGERGVLGRAARFVGGDVVGSPPVVVGRAGREADETECHRGDRAGQPDSRSRGSPHDSSWKVRRESALTRECSTWRSLSRAPRQLLVGDTPWRRRHAVSRLDELDRQHRRTRRLLPGDPPEQHVGHRPADLVGRLVDRREPGIARPRVGDVVETDHGDVVVRRCGRWPRSRASRRGQ